ncbi:ABC transporter permease [Nocardia inohanensis]|uniref:ABC transporter permease n=1 Tax=Nocardia inohanensis TaxID=209246 RepID=UPI000835FD4B|nr:ABC transporter permease [Nocardia inohanensis]
MNLVTVPEPVLRAANSEVRKVVSLRLNQLLGGGVALVGVLAFAVLGIRFTPAVATDKHPVFGAVGTSATAVAFALALAVLASAVFGALSAGDEYKYGSLPVSAVFTPDRNLLLGSKLAVAAWFSLVVVLGMEVVGAAALLLLGRDKAEFTVELLAVLGGVTLAAVCWAVIGAALGFLLRSPVQAVAVIVGLLVLEPLVWIVARGIGFPGFATILPVAATVGTMSDGSYADSAAIAPTPAAIVVLLLWTAAAGAAAWWYTQQRDL